MDELVSRFSEAEARELTDEIKADYGALQVKIATAWRGRVWIALGHESWQDYIDTEFAGVSIRPPKDLEAQVVKELRDAGMSTRGIAAATELSQPTVSRRLAAGDSDESREAASAGFEIEADHDGLEPPTPPIVGLDGKEYARKPAPQPAEVIHDAEIVEDEADERTVDELGLEPLPVDLSGRPAFGSAQVNSLIRELHEGGAAALPTARKRAANLEMALHSGQVDEGNLDRLRLEALGADLADAVKVLAGLLSTVIHVHPAWREASVEEECVEAVETTRRIFDELATFTREGARS